VAAVLATACAATVPVSRAALERQVAETERAFARSVWRIVFDKGSEVCGP